MKILLNYGWRGTSWGTKWFIFEEEVKILLNLVAWALLLWFFSLFVFGKNPQCFIGEK